jgi:hypothetical protein
MQDNSDLIGKVCRHGITKLNDKPAEGLLWRIERVGDDGLLVGVCINEDPRLNGRVMPGMDPDSVRRRLSGEVVSLDDRRSKRG